MAKDFIKNAGSQQMTQSKEKETKKGSKRTKRRCLKRVNSIFTENLFYFNLLFCFIIENIFYRVALSKKFYSKLKQFSFIVHYQNSKEDKKNKKKL